MATSDTVHVTMQDSIRPIAAPITHFAEILIGIFGEGEEGVINI